MIGIRNEIFTTPNPNLALGTNRGVKNWAWGTSKLRPSTSVASDDGVSVTLRALADYDNAIDIWSYLAYKNLDLAQIAGMAEGDALILSFMLRCNSRSALRSVMLIKGNGVSPLTDAADLGEVKDDERWHRYCVRLRRIANAEFSGQWIYFYQGEPFREGDYYSFRDLKLERGAWSPYVMGGGETNYASLLYVIFCEGGQRHDRIAC